MSKKSLEKLLSKQISRREILSREIDDLKGTPGYNLGAKNTSDKINEKHKLINDLDKEIEKTESELENDIDPNDLDPTGKIL